MKWKTTSGNSRHWMSWKAYMCVCVCVCVCACFPM